MKFRLSSPIAGRVATLGSLSMLLFAAMVSFEGSPVSAAAADEVSIRGEVTAFQSPVLDFCKALGVTTCPIGVAVKEQYLQEVSFDLAADRSIVQQGDRLMMSIAASPQPPTATFVFEFTFLGKTYTSTFMPQSIPAIGAGQTEQVSIPLKLILVSLGVPLPPLVPIPGSFTASLQAVMKLQGITQSAGFSDGVPLEWGSAGTLAEPVALMNYAPTSTFRLSTATSVQDWGVSFKISDVPLVGTIDLYTLPLTETRFEGSGGPTLSYYKVSVEPSPLGTVSPSPSTAWYVSGYQLTLHSSPQTGYQLATWSINGRSSSTHASYTITVTSPLDIQAGFEPSPRSLSLSGVPLEPLVIAMVAISLTGLGVWEYRRRYL